MSVNQEQKKLVVEKQRQLSLKQVSDHLVVDQVFGRRVLIKTVVPRTELDHYEEIGLAIPNKKENTPRPATGIVIALGHEFDPSRTNIQLGDMVLFSKYAGTDFMIDEQDFRILDVTEVLCTLREKDGAPAVEATSGS